MAVLLICMPAGWEGERAELVIFIAIPPFEFLGTVGGGWDFRWNSSVGAAILVCMPSVRRASALLLSIYLPTSPFEFSGSGGGGWGFRRIPTICGGAFEVHTSGSVGRAF